MSLLTSKECEERYGDPSAEKHMTVWHVPAELVQGKIPKTVYCNIDFVAPLEQALKNVVARGLVDRIHTWDGCFCIRKKRGGNSNMSLHSWGVAVDINAKENPMGQCPKMDPALVACFVDAGLEWGGSWHTPDGMHFQLKA